MPELQLERKKMEILLKSLCETCVILIGTQETPKYYDIQPRPLTNNEVQEKKKQYRLIFVQS
jgi:hypothetical protein